MEKAIQKAGAVAALAAAMLAGAQAASPLPAVHKAGRVEYLSGGIGKDEAGAIEQASRQWPLTLEFAVKDKRRDDFAADVHVLVRDAKGDTALDATAGGPFLLARLAPGRYAVDATLAGKTLHRKVSIERGHPAKAVFVWPSSALGALS